MRALTLPLIGTAALGAAMLLDTSTLTSRSKFCANAPHTVAGTSTLDRRTRPSDNVAHRTISPGLNAVWCAPRSLTYIVVTVVSSTISSDVILNLLDDAHTSVLNHISFHGDSVIADGLFSWRGEHGVMLETFNTDNHQQTWGVLGAALYALGDFMLKLGPEAGACYFTIIDGNYQVGRGVIR